jgi:hypothetical protein
VETTTFVKIRKATVENCLNSKKIIYVDRLNFLFKVVYFDIKITDFKSERFSNNCYKFAGFISHKRSLSLNKISCCVMYHHTIYMCIFFEFGRFFLAVICTSFHESGGFHQICSRTKYQYAPLIITSN